jgi:hypothetical protein
VLREELDARSDIECHGRMSTPIPLDPRRELPVACTLGPDDGAERMARWSRQPTRLPRATAGHFRFALNPARECSTSWRHSLPQSSCAARFSSGRSLKTMAGPYCAFSPGPRARTTSPPSRHSLAPADRTSPPSTSAPGPCRRWIDLRTRTHTIAATSGQTQTAPSTPFAAE